MATRTIFFLFVSMATGLVGATARADDLPAKDWVSVMDVVIGMERVGFTPIAKIEAKQEGWLVRAYRRSVLYEIRVDPYANTIKSVSAEQVTVCSKTAAATALPAAPPKKLGEDADASPEPSTKPDASAEKTKERATRKAAVSARKPAVVRSRGIEIAHGGNQMRALAQVAGTRRNGTIQTKPAAQSHAARYASPNPVKIRRGFVVAPGRVQWSR